MIVLAPISVGELFDKITILRIKMERIKDETKLSNVSRELELLEDQAEELTINMEVDEWVNKLHKVNETLWSIEDAIRSCEREGNFSATFVDLARQVYQQNDRRSAIKKTINILLGSDLVEEKSYLAY